MKKVKFWYPIAAVFLGVSVSVLASYPAIKEIKAEREEARTNIIELDRALQAALVAQDFETVSDLLSNDFELYTINRGVLNKAQWLEELKSGRMSYQEFSNNQTAGFQGKQFSNIVEISGNFWGKEADHYPVEMTIRAVEHKEKYRIKCVTVKDVS